MRIGTIRYGWYQFAVYDDGSLACGNTWYEDAPTAARELQIDAGLLSGLVVKALTEWRGQHATRP
jgi:hypothetical protein